MYIFKKIGVTTILLLVFVMTLSMSAYAQSNDKTKHIVPKSAGVKGASVSPLYQFDNVTSFIDTNFTITVPTTESVDVVLTQWQTNCVAFCQCNLNYQLIPVSGGSNVAPIQVVGIYKSSSKTITFPNVQQGTYKLRISNNLGSSYPASGNGYIYY